MSELKGFARLEEIKALRTEITGIKSSYKATGEKIAAAVKPEGFDQYNRVLVVIDGKQAALELARGVAKDLASYDVIVESNSEPVKYIDQFKDVKVIPVNTPRVRLVAPVAA